MQLLLLRTLFHPQNQNLPHQLKVDLCLVVLIPAVECQAEKCAMIIEQSTIVEGDFYITSNVGQIIVTIGDGTPGRHVAHWSHP